MISRFERRLTRRERVLRDERNKPLLVRPGVLNSWASILEGGDLFFNPFSEVKEISRCNGVSRTRPGCDMVMWQTLDGEHIGYFMAIESDRVERLDMLDLQDIEDFCRVIAAKNLIMSLDVKKVESSLSCPVTEGPMVGKVRNKLHERSMSPAERERKRRASETTEQSAERRRKNAENMRKKRAGK